MVETVLNIKNKDTINTEWNIFLLLIKNVFKINI
jgi:hypothetical protein